MMTKVVVLLLLLAMALLSVEVQSCPECLSSFPQANLPSQQVCSYLDCVHNKCFEVYEKTKVVYSAFDCNGAHGLLSSPILLVTAAATILVYIRG